MSLRLRFALIALAIGSVPVLPDDAHAQAKRGKGFVREPDAVFQKFPVAPRYRAFLPAEFDLSSGFPTPGNQGSQSSCTAWAVGYAMRSYYEGRRQNWNFASTDQLISPAYIYNRLQNFSGDCNVGIAISAALDLLQRDGAPTLAMFPYSPDNCSLAPDPKAEGAAPDFRIRAWRALDAGKLDDAKGQIHLGNPVVFGMEISDSFESHAGDAIYDDTSSPRIGGHAMVLVGYSERRQAFKVINSWGTDWGDHGFAWISYRAIKELADRMYVMEMAPYTPPLVVAPPLPVPAPTPAPVVVTPPTPVVVTPPAPIVVTPPTPVVVTPPAPVVVAPPPPAPVPPKPAPVQVVVSPPAPVVVTPPTPVLVTPPAPVVVAPPQPLVVATIVDPVPKPVPAPSPPKPVITPAPPKPVVVAPPKPPAPVIPPVAAMQKQITARLREVPCARLEGNLSSDRAVRISGFAGGADELAKLRDDLLAMPGVRRVDSEARIYPWPQCEVQLSFSEALAQGKGTAVRLRGGDGGNFREGDSLAIEVVTPSYPSYLYVSYLQANGDVAHLAWPQGRIPRPAAPNSKITFGGGADGQSLYRIGAPFGDEMIVVVASASPLFSEELPDSANDREYLTSFRKAFLLRPQGGGGQRTVAAVAVPLKTQAR